MGIARGMVERRSYDAVSGVAKPEDWLVEVMGGRPTTSGVRVNQSSAMRATAVYACVSRISKDIAKLPLVVYQRLQPRGKQRAVDHPLYELLDKRPNPWQSSFNWRETGQACLLLWGNDYSEIEYNRAGRPVALWPIRPDRMRPEKVKDARGRYSLVYHVSNEEGRIETLPMEYVLHTPSMAMDGLVGLSVIGYWREAIGLYLAAQEYGARYFGQDATPGLILEAPRKLSQEEKDTLKEDFRVKYEGLSKKFRLGVLEKGWTLKNVEMPIADAQFLELRKFQVLEICRMFHMPPHKIASMDAATYTNIEHQGIEYQTDTIEPWIKLREQIYNWRLFGEGERKTYFAEFLMDGLLRGDTATRTDSYQKRIMSGSMTPNEAREKENENPLPGGDDLWMPMNMIPASMAAEIEPGGEGREISPGRVWSMGEIRAKKGAALRGRLASSYKRIFGEAAKRLVKREVQDVRAAAKKAFGSRGLDEFEIWLEDYYRKFPETAEMMMLPAYASYAEALLAAASQEIGMDSEMTPALEEFTRKVASAFATKHSGSSQAQLRKVVNTAAMEGEDPLEAIEGRLDEWEEKTPDKVSMRETVRFGGAFARAFFFSAGITTLVWVAGAKACPLCQELDGQSVGRMASFVAKGAEVTAEGSDPLTVDSNINHPPLHDGCECMISPG